LILVDAGEHYTFVSTSGVYKDFPRVAGIDESAPTYSPPLTEPEHMSLEAYGALKIGCEQAAERAMPGRVLTIRSGQLVGPYDPTGRFMYWPRRVAEGGDVLVPSIPELLVQFIDARDLAEWMLSMAEVRKSGTFNATGPAYPLTMEELLRECSEQTGGDATLHWVDEQFLISEGVTPRGELPLWMPNAPGPGRVNCGKVLGAGLTFRPLADTIVDTLAWDSRRPADIRRPFGMTRERETELLQAWQGHTRATPHSASSPVASHAPGP